MVLVICASANTRVRGSTWAAVASAQRVDLRAPVCHRKPDSMNRIKGIFILAYPALVIVIALVAITMIVDRGPVLSWIGALVTVLPFLGLQIRAKSSKKLARTSHRLPILSSLTLAGAVLSAYGFMHEGAVDFAPLIAAAIGLVGFFLFDFWYSTFGRRIGDRLLVGEKLPSFSLEDPDGTVINSESLLGQPLLLMFYRGNWCPFCMGQVREITERYRELIDRGVKVVLVSPQPPDITRRVADIFRVPFLFLVDRELSAARALDILQKNGVPPGPTAKKFGPDTVLPTVIITDPDGRILFTDQTRNFRVRPEPKIFFRVLSSNGF